MPVKMPTHGRCVHWSIIFLEVVAERLDEFRSSLDEEVQARCCLPDPSDLVLA